MDYADSFITLARRCLWPLSTLYGIGVRLRNRRYDRQPRLVRRAALPVISVGNLTVGGTGKTPIVMEIVRRLSALHRRPAVLTRGYGARAGEHADEVCEYADRFPDVPVIVNPDRIAGAQSARDVFQADCLVLDDGFQHRRLARDLDLVVVDALDPWGGDRLLPAGRLREPLSGAIRADIFVISRADQVEHGVVLEIERRLASLNAGAPCLFADVAPTGLHSASKGVLGVAEMGYHDVLPVCGIGNPQSFLHSVASLAGRVCGRRTFPDHHRYARRHVVEILDAARRLEADWVVTTHKDWVKLAPLWPVVALDREIDLVRLDVRLVLRDEDGALERELRHVLETEHE